MGQAFAQFGNVQFTQGWSLDYQGGAAPSVCTIRTVPNLSYLEKHGTLTLGDDTGTLRLQDCLLLSPSFTDDHKWDLPILDRRWKWQFGVIDGAYNIRRPDGTYVREKSPIQLATLLLEAMGERNYDIGRLPNFARPEVNWSSQNPAAMFDDLVSTLGCTWTLDYFRNMVVVWPIGSGNDLPDGPTVSRQFGISSIARPDTITVRGSRTLCQARFATEAVAKDTDGKIKRLGDLKGYSVTDTSDPEDWSSIDEDLTYNSNGETKKVRDLAKQWVYRAYRITGLVDGGWCPSVLKGSKHEPKSFFDLEFIDSRAEQEIDENDVGVDGQPSGRKVNKPVSVSGYWYNNESESTGSATQWQRYEGHIQFDARLGIVKFGEPVYLVTSASSDNHGPAYIYVDVGFYAGRDGIFVRPVVDINTGENRGTGARVIVRDEIEDRQIHHYERLQFKKVESQPYDVFDRLQYYADAALKEYTDTPSATRTYKGLLPIVPDGRIRQVTWAGGDGSGPTTQVSVNKEHNPYTPTIEDARRKQAISDLLKVPPWLRTAQDRKLLTGQL